MTDLAFGLAWGAGVAALTAWGVLIRRKHRRELRALDDHLAEVETWIATSERPRRSP